MKTSLSTKVFYILIIAVKVLITVMFFSPEVQRVMMSRLHLRGDSFAAWAALQFVPSMYNFSNRIEVENKTVELQLNHYPLRVIIFNPSARVSLAQSGGRYRVVLDSRYRGTELRTVYEMTVSGEEIKFAYVDE